MKAFISLSIVIVFALITLWLQNAFKDSPLITTQKQYSKTVHNKKSNTIIHYNLHAMRKKDPEKPKILLKTKNKITSIITKFYPV